MPYERELFANTDIKVTDDLEIYFVNKTEYNDFIKELNISNDLNNIFKQFNAIFQGFGRV